MARRIALGHDSRGMVTTGRACSCMHSLLPFHLLPFAHLTRLSLSQFAHFLAYAPPAFPRGRRGRHVRMVNLLRRDDLPVFSCNWTSIGPCDDKERTIRSLYRSHLLCVRDRELTRVCRVAWRVMRVVCLRVMLRRGKVRGRSWLYRLLVSMMMMSRWSGSTLMTSWRILVPRDRCSGRNLLLNSMLRRQRH